MGTSYDPDKIPGLDVEMIRFAREREWHIIPVICDQEGAEQDDHVGVSFMAAGPFLPRPGDHIDLEDGKTCLVRQVIFRLGRSEEGHLVLIPNVVATFRE